MSHNPIPVRCRAFLNDFSAFVDGELPPRRRDEIQAHVDCCQACLDHLTAYRRGITVLRSIEADVPGELRVEACAGLALRIVAAVVEQAVVQQVTRGIAREFERCQEARAAPALELAQYRLRRSRLPRARVVAARQFARPWNSPSTVLILIWSPTETNGGSPGAGAA